MVYYTCEGLTRMGNLIFTIVANSSLKISAQSYSWRAFFFWPDADLLPGEAVLLLHLWNEHLSAFPPRGADLAWATHILHGFKHSLSLVAGYLQDEPRCSQVRAVGGETILLSSGMHAAGKRFVQDLGFTVTPYHSQLGRFGEFWENLFSWTMIWTFNPGGLPDRSILRLSRSEMWIGREAFLQRFLTSNYVSS
jgi:hypothetical protein